MDGYLKDIAKILAFAAGVAALPLMLAFAKLQPPWPPAIEYVSAAFVMMAALVMWEWGRSARRSVRRGLMIAGMLLTVLGAGAYLPLYSMFVQLVPDSGDRLIKGLTCMPDAQRIFPGHCPFLTSDDIASAEWDVERLWTQGSILQVRMMLVAAWLCFTAGLVAFVGAVVVGRPVSRPPRARAPGAGDQTAASPSTSRDSADDIGS